MTDFRLQKSRSISTVRVEYAKRSTINKIHVVNSQISSESRISQKRTAVDTKLSPKQVGYNKLFLFQYN